MSSFGRDHCPGEPCSLSLDHNFYPSDSEALHSAPFNTLESDWSEEPRFSDFVCNGTPPSEESPSFQRLADAVRSPPPDARIEKSGIATSLTSPRGQNCRSVGHCESESSSSSLLELWKSRRVRVAPHVHATLADVCLLPQPAEQLPVSSKFQASASAANILSDADNAICVSTAASTPLVPDFGNAVQEKFSPISWGMQGQPEHVDAAGNSGGDGGCCSSLVQKGHVPYADSTSMQQVVPSDRSPNLVVGDVHSDSVANSKPRSVRTANIYAGAEITQPRNHVPSRENGWRCPRANKRPRTSRQSLLDSWIA